MNGTIIKNGITYGTNISDSQPVGQIIESASETTPAGYLPCDGRSLLRSDYPDLFKKIGTTYGAEDDEHFNLPNENDLIINDSDTNLQQTWSSKKIEDKLKVNYGGIDFTPSSGYQFYPSITGNSQVYYDLRTPNILHFNLFFSPPSKTLSNSAVIGTLTLPFKAKQTGTYRLPTGLIDRASVRETVNFDFNVTKDSNIVTVRSYVTSPDINSSSGKYTDIIYVYMAGSIFII